MQPIRFKTSLGVFLLLVVPAFLSAQVPSDEILKEFKFNGDFIFELAGTTHATAEVYFSERAVAYLVMGSPLASPIMISPRTQSVESVHLMKVYKKDDGTIDLLADARLEPVSSFTLKEHNVVFTLDGQSARLMPRPWLLGRQTGEGMKEHNPEYAFKASQYTPRGENIEWLRGQGKDVRVRVYFGSWCPHCKEMVPRVLRVADEIGDSKIEFEYFGFPSPFGDDPEAKSAGIRSVPTAVIYVDGKEAERLDGDSLKSPETALRGILIQGAS